MQTLDDHTIYVREDREDNAVRGRSPRAGERSGAFRGGRGGGGGGGGGSGAAADGTKVGASHLSANTHVHFP